MVSNQTTPKNSANGGSNGALGTVPISFESSSSEEAIATSHDRQVASWLLLCCAMIFLMVVIGGVTRLTRSGLSMVEWKPIMGAIPPLNRSQWLQAFEKYKAYPEYKVRRGMSLGEFQQIFLVEYTHRLFGRLIGLVFFFPFLFFLLRGRLRKGLAPRLAGIFILGGLQGLLGWFMVKSGLINEPRVSAYRLTAHLGLAFLLYASVLWVALGLLGVGKRTPQRRDKASRDTWQALRKWGWIVPIVVSVMVLSGGLVAGNRAGFVFNTFPQMNGQWVPQGLLQISPWYVNFFENVITVQFVHRVFACVLCVLLPYVWWRGRSLQGSAKLVLSGLLGVLALQVTMGILTLLWAVPVPLAAAHQAGALLLFTFAILFAYLMLQTQAAPEVAITPEGSLEEVGTAH